MTSIPKPLAGYFCEEHSWKGYSHGFCDECGNKLVRCRGPLCKTCAEEILFEVKYCSRCGTKL